METITGLLIDVLNNTSAVVDVPNTMTGFRDALHSRCLAFTRWRWEGKPFAIICTGAGYKTPENKTTIKDKRGRKLIGGSVFIVKATEDYGMESLTLEDCAMLFAHAFSPGDDYLPVINDCEYYE